MYTKVFVSWSGSLSRQLGEVLRNWLPQVLQHVQPYFTPKDIEKGARWNSDIAHELKDSSIGVICLTRDNIEKPWVLFEAGALSRSFEESRVCPILFNIEPTDLKGPLTSFQTTKFVREDIKRLVITINSTAGQAKLDNSILESVFEMWWPRLQQQVLKILKTHEIDTSVIERSDRDILQEILELSRMSTSHYYESLRIDERIIKEFVECLDELRFVAIHECNDKLSPFLSRLDRPLRHLCTIAGVPQIWDGYHLHQDPQERISHTENDRGE